MSRYRYTGMSGTEFIIFIIIMIFMMMIPFILNANSSEIWNDGICPDCETRYVMTGAAGVSNYFTCPDCGQKITRYYAR